MFEDITRIRVVRGDGLDLLVDNPTEYKLINKGAQGAVFRLDEDKCVKVYALNTDAELEREAYIAAQHTMLLPRLYDYGINYNIIGYIDGPNLYDYLKQKGKLDINLTLKLIMALETMKAVGFIREDAALWHFLLDKNNDLKLIDVVHALVFNEKEPIKIITGFYSLGLLEEFLEHTRLIDQKKYDAWKDIKPRAAYS